jgi:hypothetical protein
MNAPAPLRLSNDQKRELNRATRRTGLLDDCLMFGFGAVVTDGQADLQWLAEHVRRAGGDLEGWCP